MREIGISLFTVNNSAKIFLSKVEGDFSFGGFQGIGRVNEIFSAGKPVIAANRAGIGFDAVGCANHGTDDRNRLFAFQNHRNGRGGHDEFFQPWIERLFNVFRVMLVCQFRGETNELHGANGQPFAFKAGEDFAH